MSNDYKRPRLDPVVRLEHQLALAQTRIAVLTAENVTYCHASNTLTPHVMRLQRQLQCQLQAGMCDEV
ncbi:MAG: hypothetical protein F4090_05015 [Nitrospira sp. SB0672_bin_25]|nr:hypothetical protein [Nitrospira sp. SB0666_bin_27]MYF24253.1 hypothetical protein [Nitrospira sp. SB0678_bin_10]MYJ54253.1 hypothetical protein [Nitrospira sp. SB0672_bin_25]